MNIHFIAVVEQAYIHGVLALHHEATTGTIHKSGKCQKLMTGYPRGSSDR